MATRQPHPDARRGAHAALAAHAPARDGRNCVLVARRRRVRSTRDGRDVGRAESHGRGRPAVSLRAVPMGLGSRGHDRIGVRAGSGRARRRQRPCGRGVGRSPDPAVRRSARRRVPVPEQRPAGRAGPGQAPRAGAAGARAARHRRSPRVGHRHPGPSRADRRRVPSRGRARRPRRRREGGVARTDRDAHHRRRPSPGRANRPQPTTRCRRHRATRQEHRESAPCRRHPDRRPRRAASVGRRGAVPPRPGVGHERAPPRPPRHPRPCRRQRPRRQRAAHRLGRRRRPANRHRLVLGLRAARHGRAGQTPRRCLPGRSEPRRGWTVYAELPKSGKSA